MFYILKETYSDNPNFLSPLLWNYGASFNSVGVVNLHNIHYWSEQNPHLMRQVRKLVELKNRERKNLYFRFFKRI